MGGKQRNNKNTSFSSKVSKKFFNDKHLNFPQHRKNFYLQENSKNWIIENSFMYTQASVSILKFSSFIEKSLTLQNDNLISLCTLFLEIFECFSFTLFNFLLQRFLCWDLGNT
jgi:hypothetical protein